MGWKKFTVLYRLALLLLGANGLALSPTQLLAQSYQLPRYGAASYTTCSGTLCDDGGPTSNYSGNSEGIVTLTPATAGSKIQLTFTMVDVDYPRAAISVYDGPSTSSLLIDSFGSGTHTLHATNTKGELTVRLYSNGSAQPKPGFAATISCETNVLLPDLVVQHATVAPTRVMPTQLFTTQVQLSNPSTLPTLNYVSFYFSTDSVYSPNDIYMGGSVGERLAPGQSTPYGIYFRVPTGTVPGRYYALCIADQYHAISENNETNNLAYAPVDILPPAADLQPELFGTPASIGSVVPGEGRIVACTVVNQGVLASPPTTVGYYLSRDNMLSPDDDFIDEAPLIALAAGASAFTNAGVSIAPTTPYGRYYVFFVADYLHELAENDETNNVAYATLDVVPPTVDLTILYTPLILNQAGAGSTLSTICYVANHGNVTANPCTVGYYLSTDATLSADDVLIGDTLADGSTTLGVLLASNYSHADGRITIPPTTAPGNYYVLFVADYLQKLAETNEDNNVAYAPIQVTTAYADLAIPATPIVSPTQAVAGTKISAICTLQNLGNGLASPAIIGYYLSANQVLDAQDILIGQTTASPVYPGTGAYIPGTAIIPAATASGAYYVLFVADPFSQLAESNETNNGNYAALRILVMGVDLTVQAPTATPTSIVAGGTVAASATLFNGGNTEAGSSPIGFYLSTNATFDATDVLLSASPGGALTSAAGSARRATLTVPTGTATGNYYLLLVADPLNIVPEADERNNMAFLPLTITGTFSGTVVPASGSSTITACAGKVYDNSGPSDYPNNADGTLTIMPGTSGGLVELTFSAFATEKTVDYLEVYDGLTTSAQLLGTFTGTGLPGTMRASNSSTTGALTLRFVSNGSTNAAGFEATISCAQTLAAREQTAGYQLSVAPNPAASSTPLQVQLSGPGAV